MRNTFTAVFWLILLFCIPTFAQDQPAPNFQVMDTNDQLIDLHADYLNQGKTVLLELFWEGCPPCNSFAPFLGDLYKDWGDGAGDVEFIALDILLNENNNDVINFQTRHNHTWPGVSATGGSVGAAGPYTNGTVYGTYLGTPTTVIIAPDGTVQYNVNGFNRNQTGIDLLDAALRATGAKKPSDDTAAPAFIFEPTAIADISCADAFPTQQTVNATDSCGVVILSSVDDYTVDNCNGYQVTYRWTAADTCGNTTDFTRSFNVLADTQVPVFNKDPTPIPNVTCGSSNPDPEILTASSACGPATVTFSIDDYTPDICNGNTITYRWLATSACGLTAEKTMSFITTHDRNPPVFTSEPDSIPNIRCNQVKPLPQMLSATTGCTEVTVTFSVDDYEEDLCNGYPITYRWTATDACGSSSVKTRTFQVLPDDSEIIFNKEPSSFADIACGETFPTADNITAFLRCGGDLPVAFSIERSSEETCGRTITYRWVTTDPCGNEIVKTTSFNVGVAVVTTKTITGGVVNPKNEGVEDVTLFFSGGTSTSVTTNTNGQFAVPDLPVNASYTISPEKNGVIDEGVTTFDLVLITKHILGETPFTEDAQFIAADANLSNSVTSFDIVLIRKVILGIDNSFPAGSWRFIPEQIVLPSLENVNDLSFTGIKIGDVSGAKNFTQVSNETRNRVQPISLTTTDQLFSKGAVIEATLSLPSSEPLLGFQFTLDFPAEALQLIEVENIGLSNFDPTNFNSQQPGKLAISWFDINQAASGDILKVKFVAKKNEELKESLQLTSSMVKAEAYSPTEAVTPIDLQFLQSSNEESTVHIYPNPVSDNFTIQTYVKEPTDLLIEIFRLDGTVIQKQQYLAGARGHQTINMQMTSATAGMYWVKVSDEEGVRDIVKLIQQ